MEQLFRALAHALQLLFVEEKALLTQTLLLLPYFLNETFQLNQVMQHFLELLLLLRVRHVEVAEAPEFLAEQLLTIEQSFTQVHHEFGIIEVVVHEGEVSCLLRSLFQNYVSESFEGVENQDPCRLLLLFADVSSELQKVFALEDLVEFQVE